jgi:hypothetical protein
VLFRRVVAVVSSDGVRVYIKGQPTREYAAGDKLPRFGGVLMVANVVNTAIRVGDEFDTAKYFPLGDRMNEDTHIFDGVRYGRKWLMAALPVNIAEAMAVLGETIGGKKGVSRLDTVENIAVRRYAGRAGAWLVLLPQDGGLRMLYVADGAPQWARHPSIHAQYRDDQLRLAMRGQDVYGAQAVFLDDGRDNTDTVSWLRDYFPAMEEDCLW